MVGDKIANMRLGENQHRQGLQICRPSEPAPVQPSAPSVSKAQATKMMNVSERSVRRHDRRSAKRVRETNYQRRPQPPQPAP